MPRTAKQLQKHFNTDGATKARFRSYARALQTALSAYGFYGGAITLESFDRAARTVTFRDKKFKVRYTFHGWYIEDAKTDISAPRISDAKPKTATTFTVRNLTDLPYTASNEYESETSRETETTTTDSNQIDAGVSGSATLGMGGTDTNWGATALFTLGFSLNYIKTMTSEVAKVISEEQEKGASGEMEIPGGRAVKFTNTHRTCRKEITVTSSGVQNCAVTLDLSEADTKGARNHDKKGNIHALKDEAITAKSLEELCAILLGCQGDARSARADIFSRAVSGRNGERVGAALEVLLDREARRISDTRKVEFPSADEFVTKIEPVAG